MPEDLTSTASRTPLLMSVQAGMATGSTITVALRFYTRFVVTHNVGYDDWCMLAALVGFSSLNLTISTFISPFRAHFADMMSHIRYSHGESVALGWLQLIMEWADTSAR